ncbi:DUF397 domain-containing protein [Nocardia jejuensis]|uniref:DUF397 domain-containing protein n=1 Tax=Nocardia jejuensis TaxID=328049 RepID=UPI000829FE06|nr:DUF397 domain-containing protein [Nocardia jejuensis]
MTDHTSAVWRTSSYSGNGGNCVEVALSLANGLVGVRDSKDNRRGPILHFTPAQWEAFLAGIDHGRLARP